MTMKIKTSADTHKADYSITKLLETPGGLEKLALEELPVFIREQRDYEAFGRKVLFTHNITSEDTHPINNEPYVYYEKDQNSHAAFYADDAEVPRHQIEGEGVNVAIMTVFSDDNTIHLKRLLTQKYNYLERVRELAGQSIGKAEDQRIINLVERLILGDSEDKTAPQFDDQIVTTSDSELSIKHMVQLKKTQSQHGNGIPVAAFVMHQSRLDDLLGWNYEEIDRVTQREILETGVKYKIWGHIKLITSGIINKDVVYSFAEKEYVGRMPILKDLSVRLTEKTNKLEKGLFMFEFIGMYLASQKAVGKLILNFEDGDDKIILDNDDSAVASELEVQGYGSLEGK